MGISKKERKAKVWGNKLDGKKEKILIKLWKEKEKKKEKSRKTGEV